MDPNVTKEILLFHLMFASLICWLSSKTFFDEKKKKPGTAGGFMVGEFDL